MRVTYANWRLLQLVVFKSLSKYVLTYFIQHFLRCSARFQYLAPLARNMIYVDHMRLLHTKRTELRSNSFGEHVRRKLYVNGKNS